jgi:F420-non-reducing hydrogenase large subunit
MGSFIHSHGVHFFALAGPDLLLGLDADPALRNIVGLVQKAPDLAKKALRLRTIGQRVTEEIGGRGTHPVSFVAGGVAAPLAKEKRETLTRLSDEGVALGAELFKTAKETLFGNRELLEALPLETHYLATVNDGALDFYKGDLRLTSPDGANMDFSEEDWASYLHEETNPNSYAKFVFCKDSGGNGVDYRVGPLARLNCADRIDTPLANAELQEMREAGHPCHQTVMYHFARLVEVLHAAEKLAELVKDEELYSDDVRARPGTPRSATAHVEAPRGVLIHDYKVDGEGIVTGCNLIVATQQNVPAINASVGMAAAKYLDQPDELLLNAIEFSIRCYDPCLSCATHRIGEMKLDVEVRHNGATVRRARR